MNLKRSEAIKNLLISRTHADLAALYNPDMEVQVNVGQDGGERIDGTYKGRTWHGWTDGKGQTWKSFRIPLNAKTKPEDNDSLLTFDLSEHAEGIGMTGWDWRNQVSRWVAYDFDDITDHSAKHAKKLTDNELQQIQEVVQNIPWITVRSSTGGKGLHLYVFLDPVIGTKNHTEHAAVARAILGTLAAITGFDFQTKVDTCGGNMWVWHRKMGGKLDGLALLKTGTTFDNVPSNWQDHVDVVSRRNRKVIPSFIGNTETAYDLDRMFEELTSQKSRVPLDDEHQKLNKFLNEISAVSWWDNDNWMLVTHTHYLKRAHEELGMRGIFQTNSPATDLNTQNCYCFPMRRGAWVVRRFTPGVAEAPTWDQDGTGWTRCFLNQEPDLQTAARAKGGMKTKTGAFVFQETEMAMKAAEMLGVRIEPALPNWIMTSRSARLKEQKDGTLLFQIDQMPTDQNLTSAGWVKESKTWDRIFTIPRPGGQPEPEVGNYDDVIRKLTTETGDDYGWMIKREGKWGMEPRQHVLDALCALGMKANEARMVIGSGVLRPWRLVCRPFQPEILGDRDWNRNAPQMAFSPTMTDSLSYPTWLKILNHVGKSLDESVKNNNWAKANGILTGADYLQCWISSLFKEPLEPLPYLFLYGPQNSGKSILHEALTLLVTCGVVRADTALVNQSGFNAELENAVLAVVEETDLRKEKSAYNRIKDWVTSPHLPIHRKNRTPYSVPNTTHWIQCANHPQACPVLPGDSRITMMYVDAIDPANLIPKKDLIIQLKKEAPDFLAALLLIELPPSGDRLNVPVIETGEKRLAQDSNRTYLEIFLEEECYYIPGKYMKLADFHARFIEWIDPQEASMWTKIKIGRELPTRFPKGRVRKDNSVCIGNISFQSPHPDDTPLSPLRLVGDYLEYSLKE